MTTCMCFFSRYKHTNRTIQIMYLSLFSPLFLFILCFFSISFFKFKNGGATHIIPSGAVNVKLCFCNVLLLYFLPGNDYGYELKDVRWRWYKCRLSTRTWLMVFCKLDIIIHPQLIHITKQFTCNYITTIETHPLVYY